MPKNHTGCLAEIGLIPARKRSSPTRTDQTTASDGSLICCRRGARGAVRLRSAQLESIAEPAANNPKVPGSRLREWARQCEDLTGIRLEDRSDEQDAVAVTAGAFLKRSSITRSVDSTQWTAKDFVTAEVGSAKHRRFGQLAYLEMRDSNRPKLDLMFRERAPMEWLRDKWFTDLT
jgi:hypothetical protein